MRIIKCCYLRAINAYTCEFWHNNRRYAAYLTGIENTALPKFQVWPLRKSGTLDRKHLPKEIFTILASTLTLFDLLHCVEAFCMLEDEQKRTGKKCKSYILNLISHSRIIFIFLILKR